MDKIKITWLTDEHDCETCGSSSAGGAIVDIIKKDGERRVITMAPFAHCYNGVNYYAEEVFERILFELGYEVEEVDD